MITDKSTKEKSTEEFNEQTEESSHSDKNDTIDSRLNLTALFCAILTFLIGGLVLAGWFFGEYDFSSLGKNFIPMADETALLFLLFGLAFAFSQKSSKSRKLYYFVIGSASFIGIFSLLPLIDIVTSDTWNLGNFLGRQNEMKGGITIGKMSFLSAVCFIFNSVALFLLARKAKKISVIFSTLSLSIGYTIVVGYCYGVPFFYSATTIPMPLATAVVFIISSTGLLIASGKETFPLRYFIGDSTRARMMRNLLPAIFILLIIQAVAVALSSGNYDNSLALTNSINTIFVLFVFGAIISLLSHSIGKSIDKNINERKLAEERLNESEKKYRNIFENAKEGIFQTYPNGSYLSVNPALAKMYGFESPEELINTRKDIAKDSYYHSKERDDFLRKMEEYGFVKGHEYEVKHKDGHKIWFYEDAQAIKDENGKIQYYEGFVVDITERKRADDEIHKLNKNLELRVAERTRQLETINKELAFHIKEIEQFNFIASHDLQEPLRTLTNFTQLIKEDYAGKLDEDGNKYIDSIYNSAARMRTLVKGLLDYSLLGREGVMTSVDCNKIVSEVLSDMHDALNISRANVTVQELPTLIGYATELRLLFQNLIDNAIKFQKKESRPEIIISVVSHEDEWAFAIQDNGIGIEEKDKDKIFLIFQRMHNRSDYEGTGIGLSHCKKIVEIHGGKIWVESRKDIGSTFRFTIPIRR
jgi:PAS domain S-box-containing protein